MNVGNYANDETFWEVETYEHHELSEYHAGCC